MSEAAPLVDAWPTLVGKFILAFGDIELATFFLWQRYFPGDDAPHNFKERSRKLLFHTSKDRDISPAVGDLLREALQIADKRNAVAHNPISVQVFRHSETRQLFHQLAIKSKTGQEYISISELVDLVSRVERMARQIHLGIWCWTE